MKKLFNLLFISILLYSCMDDKGNYDYQTVSDIKIDTIGMANRMELFSLELGKEIEIEPNVTYSKNLDELEYYWVMYPYYYAPVQEGNAMVYPQADTIGRAHKLKWTVDAKPGLYYLQFAVSDPVNKLRSFFTFAGITIPAKGVKSGLYILSEYDGWTDIDLFGSARALIIGGNHFEPNYYSENHGGGMIPGKPLFISYGQDYYYAFTDQTGLRLNTNSLMLMESFNEMFYTVPVYNPSNLKYTNNCEFLVNDGRLHVLYTNRTNDRKFSNTVAGDYQAGRFLAGNTKTSYGHITDAIDADQIIFDTNTNGFRPYFPLATSIGSFKQTEANAISDANHLTGNVKATFEANGGQTYNIVEINGKDSLIVFNFYNVVDDGDLSTGSGSRVDLSGCKDIKNANCFASSNAGNAFFYATDKAVHSFSYTSGQTAQLDIYACAPNEEITALYLLPSGGFPTSGSVLWIGVWNESIKTGSLVEFEIDPTSGNISNKWSPSFAPTLTNPSVTSGFGKIKSMIIKM